LAGVEAMIQGDAKKTQCLTANWAHNYQATKIKVAGQQ
jgi:hypothetical protein